MKLSDKIISLRKQNGLSQEMLAEKLNVSRQAVSRWEQETAMPDANNILQLSKLFGVTTDYLLNDYYSSDEDIPRVKQVKEEHTRQILIFLVTIQVMAVMMQAVTVIYLKNIVWIALSFIPFIATIGGFEYAYIKSGNENSRKFRRKFYKISAWLGLYFPIRLLVGIVIMFYPRPYSSLIFEFIVLIVYITSATVVNLNIEKDGVNAR